MGWWKWKKQPIPHESEVWAPKRTMVIAWCNLGGVCFFGTLTLILAGFLRSQSGGSTVVGALWLYGSLAVCCVGIWRLSRWVEKRPKWWVGTAVLGPALASLASLTGFWFAVLQIEPAAMPLVVFSGWMILYALIVGPLANSGSRRRVGSLAHCARCEYERSASIPDSVQAVCPECGAAWNSEKGLVVGTVQRNARLQTVTWYVIAIWLGLTFFFFMPMRRRGWLATIAEMITPTSSMIRQAAASPFEIDDALESLARRSLSPSQLREAIGTITNTLGQPDDGGWKNRYAWGSALLGMRDLLAPDAWSDGDSAMLVGSLIRFTVDVGEHDQGSVCVSFELAGLRADAGRYLRFYLLVPAAVKPLDGAAAPQAIKGQDKSCVAFQVEPAHEAIEVPILVVAIPDAPRTSLTPPPVGEPSVSADGSLIPAAGALWWRVVPVTVKVERTEKK